MSNREQRRGALTGAFSAKWRKWSEGAGRCRAELRRGRSEIAPSGGRLRETVDGVDRCRPRGQARRRSKWCPRVQNPGQLPALRSE